MITAAFCVTSGSAMADDVKIHLDITTDNGRELTITSGKSYATVNDCEQSETFEMLSKDPAMLSQLETVRRDWLLLKVQNDFRTIAGRTIRQNAQAQSPRDARTIEPSASEPKCGPA